MTHKRLYKARGARVICGVCGGFAEYLGIEPTLIRLGWALFCALYGSGVLVYIVAAVVMPDPPAEPFEP